MRSGHITYHKYEDPVHFRVLRGVKQKIMRERQT